MNYNYNECIQKINSGEILRLYFKLSDYAHYSNCSIDVLQNHNGKLMFKLIMTRDKSESFLFFNHFNEKAKIFNLGRKGTYTLKQLWDRIEIKGIEYSN